jgi:hypothetical protein
MIIFPLDLISILAKQGLVISFFQEYEAEDDRKGHRKGKSELLNNNINYSYFK